MPGADPRLLTAGARALKLVESYGISKPAEIQLEDIAWASGIEVTKGPLKSAVAHMVRVGKSGLITTNETIPEEGRRRFSVAHELAHWELHSDISQVFYCSEADMRQYERSGPEIEANTFASELLVPKFMVDPQILKRDPDLSLIQALSGDFNISLTAAALRYVNLSRHPVLAVFSDGEIVKWWKRNDYRVSDVWLESGQRLSRGSVARDLALNPNQAGKFIEVSWSHWFPHCDYRGDELLECSLRLVPYRTILTLLWIPTRY